MSKMQILRKLEAMLDDAERAKMWGNIELEIRDGVPVVIRKSTTEKLESATVNTRANQFTHR